MLWNEQLSEGLEYDRWTHTLSHTQTLGTGRKVTFVCLAILAMAKERGVLRVKPTHRADGRASEPHAAEVRRSARKTICSGGSDPTLSHDSGEGSWKLAASSTDLPHPPVRFTLGTPLLFPSQVAGVE